MVFDHALAAFLTQTVTIDEQTTVKFEIWYMFPIFVCLGADTYAGTLPDRNAIRCASSLLLSTG